MRATTKLVGVVLAAGLAAACGPASVSGTVGGKSLDSSDATGKRSTFLGTTTAEVWIGGNTTNLCADISAGVRRMNATYLKLSFGEQGGLVPGQFAIGGIPVVDSKYAAASTIIMDSACNDAVNKDAGGGSITLESFSDTQLKGSFSLAFGADMVSGSFTAATCGWTSTSQSACQ
jgi:hypothetical protein